VVAIDSQLGFTSGTPAGKATVSVNAVNGCSATTARTVVICVQATNSSISSPVSIAASIQPGSSPIRYVQVWVDGVKQHQTTASTLTMSNGAYAFSASLPMSAATHRITVQAIDISGAFKATGVRDGRDFIGEWLRRADRREDRRRLLAGGERDGCLASPHRRLGRTWIEPHPRDAGLH
jgi:hypothetical protein